MAGKPRIPFLVKVIKNGEQMTYGKNYDYYAKVKENKAIIYRRIFDGHPWEKYCWTSEANKERPHFVFAKEITFHEGTLHSFYGSREARSNEWQ